MMWQWLLMRASEPRAVYRLSFVLCDTEQSPRRSRFPENHLPPPPSPLPLLHFVKFCCFILFLQLNKIWYCISISSKLCLYITCRCRYCTKGGFRGLGLGGNFCYPWNFWNYMGNTGIFLPFLLFQHRYI